MNLPELFRNYLEGKGISRITVKNYLSDLRRFFQWFEQSFGRVFEPQDLTSDITELFKKTNGGTIDNSELSIINSQSSVRSFERYLSSLRKFAQFLKEEKLIEENPFDLQPTNNNLQPDSWQIKAFRDYLYVYGSSKLTIKNYLVDILAFTKWIEQAQQVDPKHALEGIRSSLIEEYKERLINVLELSPKSINRKLSSIRKYVEFGIAQGYIKNTELGIKNYESRQSNLKLEDFKETEEKLGQKDTKYEIQNTRYSPFPPVRLFQKLFAPYSLLEDLFAEKIARKIHNARLETKAGKTNDLSISNIIKFKAGRSLFVKHKSFGTGNIKKEFFAPHEISLKGLPFHKKLFHHARFTRPDWYKRYHTYPLVHYFHFAVLVIYASSVGFLIYTALFSDAQNQKALAAPVAPPRILSFQGRLTDQNDNPITTKTYLRFQIYNNISTTGSALLWQEDFQVTPDQDGIFSDLLGNGSTCTGQPLTVQQTRCAIPSSVFTDNAGLYLGISVADTAELTPRQRLAEVAYAANSESLQGMLPITDAAAGQTNVVLALDSSGNMTIGGSANPTFSASGGQFKLSGQPLLLTTNASSNGNIILNPDGLGKVDFEKPLVNNSATGNISPGGVEVDDKFGVLATESAVAAFVVNNNTTGGDIFAASSSGTTRFAITNGGNLNLAAGAAIDAISTGTLSIGGTTATTMSLGRSGQGITLPGFTGQNGVLFGTYTTGVLGQATTSTASQCLLSGASNPAWGTCPGGSPTSDLYWQQAGGALFPNNATVDFLIGAPPTNSTASAKFGILNVNTGTPVATISANSGNNAAYLTGDGTLATTNRGTLTIGNSSTYNTTGNVLINSNGTGNVGIGTTGPLTKVQIYDSASQRPILMGDFGCGTGYSGIGFGTTVTGCNTYSMIGDATSTYINAATGGTIYMRINNSDRLTVNGSSTTISGYATVPLVIGGTTTTSTLTLRSTSGVGATGADIIFQVGNNGGTEAMRILNNGNVGIGTISPISELHVTRPLSFGANGKALAIFDQIESQDILTASASGTPKFTIANNGNITATGTLTGLTGLTLASGAINLGSSNGTSSQCLLGGTTAGWGSCATGVTTDPFWTQGSGALFPNNSTVDFLIGTQATTSAKFSVLNMDPNSGLTPVASVSSGLNGTSMFMTADGTLATQKRMSLTIGNSSIYNTTGNVLINPNGTGLIGIATTSPRQQLSVGSYLDIYSGAANSPTQPSIRGSSLSNLVLSGYSGGAVYLSYDGGTGGTLFGNGASAIVGRVNSSGYATFGSSSDLASTTYALYATGKPSYINGDNTNSAFLMSGNVGINSTTPRQLLDVLGKAGTTQLRLSSTDNSVYTDFATDQIGMLNMTPSGGSATVSGILKVSGGTIGGRAALIVDQLGNSANDILTASASGTPKFAINNSGNIQFAGNTSYMNTLTSAATAARTYTFPDATGNVCLSTGNCGSGSITTNWWTQTSPTGGAITPLNSTMDLLVGASATTSAKFSVLNMSGTGTPVASVSSGLSGTSMYMTADGTLSTQNRMSLTIGNSSTYNTTGNTLINPNGTGNVGIGTTAPSSLFSVGSGATTYVGIDSSGNIGGTGSNILSNWDQLKANTLEPKDGTSFDLAIKGGNGSGTYVTRISLPVGSNNYVNFPAGNVGIGTTTPRQLLDVLGKAGATQFRLSSTDNSVYTDFKTDQYGMLNISPSGGSATVSGILKVSGGTTGGFAAFIVDQLGNSANDIFTASASGTPKFAVNNNGDIQFTGNTSYMNTLASAATAARTWTFPDATGNVCISTNNCGYTVGTNWWTQSSPTGGAIAPINSTMDLLVGAQATTSAKFSVLNMTGLLAPVASVSSGLNGTSAYLTAGGTLATHNRMSLTIGNSSTYNTTGNILINPNGTGNVGIGTITPGAPLHINSSNYPVMEFTDASSGSTGYIAQDYILASNGGGVKDLLFGTNGTSDGGLTFITKGNYRMSIGQDGGVAMGSAGSTSPYSASLFVSGRYKGNALVMFNDTIGNDIFTASASGTTRFVIQSGGQVGIGTRSPGNVLHTYSTTANAGIYVDGTNQPQLALLNSGSVKARFALPTGSGQYTTDASANDLVIRTEATSQKILFNVNGGGGASMMALNNGSVGIGTISPQGVLHVSGGNTGGNAALIVDQTGASSNDIVAASASGVTKFKITNGGTIYAASFYDLDNSSYFLDPAATDIALTTIGKAGIGTTAPKGVLHVSGGTYGGNAALIVDQTGDTGNDIIAASASGTTNFRVKNNGDVYVGNTGSGKITVGTVDPLYTIGGEKFSTYGTSMTGVKEETTGRANLSYDPTKQAYSYTINLTNQEKGSDLWLFSQVIDPDISLLSALLTPDKAARVWYEKDVSNRTITLLSDTPTIVSYRLTAPRFDYEKWGNYSNEADSSILGLVVPSSNNIQTATSSALAIEPQFDITKILDTFGNPVYVLIDSFGNTIKKAESFSHLVAANIKAGLVSAQEITTGSLSVANDSVTIAGQSLHDYIAQIATEIINQKSSITNPLASADQINTNIISPLAGNEIAVKGDMAVKDGNNKTVAKIDTKGSLTAQNASISGSLSTEKLQTTDATISGTLYADKIQANSIEGLEAKISTIAANLIKPYQDGTGSTLQSTSSGGTQTNIAIDQISSVSGQLASNFIDISNLSADFATFRDGLISLGPATFKQASVIDSFSIGTSFVFGPNSMDTLGQDLEIQPLKQGNISFMAGAVRINTDGTLIVNENATFTKDVEIRGKLSANIISPLPNQDLSLSLPDQSKYQILNSSDSAVLAVNPSGDLTSSGSGTFAKLNLFAQPVEAVSDTEVVATSSAGTVALKAFNTEVTIDNPLVTDKSLIYITPVGNTSNPLYLLRQNPGVSFTVGTNKPSYQDIQFNFLIVN